MALFLQSGGIIKDSELSRAASF